ncbi:MAG: 30S ribosomal protein S16 [Patescibacteria group bacterium]|nr:30S ribosomal protein S16 [Patescibacteria group bacterium]MDD5121166.1 30S ribosomal protein S16 [Patescibacteria group bacterium]MDD5221681.1 30S ribosomal protein S16 [Patescibacteria group bacterium]MDD5395915.1 30S ribosomal protein S16 [Patescibacteria group bacterium]
MLAIKLARRGKKNQPLFRLLVQEKAKDPFGDFLEELGHWNPKTKQGDFNKERIVHWISQGAQPTPSVNNLLINQGIIEGKKMKASKKPQTKEQPKVEEAKKEEAPAAEAK